MLRKIVLFLVALSAFAAFAAFARTRAASHPSPVTDNGTVSGTVSRVQGNLIEIAQGTIAIDATNAKIVIGRGREGTVANIQPGMQLFAAVGPMNPSSHGGLPARLITVTRPHDATLSGPVLNVDRASRTFFMLNETIHVDDQTSFGGYKREGGTTFDDVMTNVIVHVQADVVNGRLIAREVLVVAPAPPQVRHVRGVVKSIGTDSWTIETERKETITVVVNAQTKIVGSPKVGDTVEVLYNVDSANNFVAVSIVKFERTVPPSLTHFRGRVKSIGSSAWTITADDGDRNVTVNESTRIMPGIVVGDLVEVMAVRKDDGTLTAVAIMKLRV